ncbi:hypothetical protein Lal_00016669 [Lupinus albus]|nr:hypothetical protein Lal_00016669 [Lupinus albus]
MKAPTFVKMISTTKLAIDSWARKKEDVVMEHKERGDYREKQGYKSGSTTTTNISRFWESPIS